MTPRFKSTYFYAFTIAAALSLTACQKGKTEKSGPMEVDANVVQADANMLSQLKVTEVIYSELSDTLRVAGQIDFDEQ